MTIGDALPYVVIFCHSSFCPEISGLFQNSRGDELIHTQQALDVTFIAFFYDSGTGQVSFLLSCFFS